MCLFCQQVVSDRSAMMGDKLRGIRVTQAELLCKDACGYYGNPAWQGFCSKCWRAQNRTEETKKHDSGQRFEVLLLYHQVLQGTKPVHLTDFSSSSTFAAPTATEDLLLPSQSLRRRRASRRAVELTQCGGSSGAGNPLQSPKVV